MVTDVNRTIWYWVRMGIYNKTLDGLRAASTQQFPSARALADFADVNPVMITRWLSGQRVPDFGKLSQVLDALNAQIVFSGEEKPSSQDEPSHFDKAVARELTKNIRLAENTSKQMSIKTGIALTRLDLIAAENTVPTPEEIFLICKELGLNITIFFNGIAENLIIETEPTTQQTRKSA
ncbi:helix-turn-helix transcriptional regulator [Maridesulfovibrio ferrireducens]|uniref:helix-turn-helix domain-containing protein n=1 Tax=Maridesulfovibrio ferrireducens TaxID=246191 RepID=UPI001A2FBCA7|nr:helix-turn-helix transcriptional regulator [Maridesulfovibrio ferrireducens]MBI9113295.1 helix-turn-helix transcriptional regulator [Maridesulfovibrio ferrireducens]